MSLPISFTNIPGSGIIVPLFTFEINSAGQYQSISRLLLMGHTSLTPPASPFPAGSQADVDAAVGAGSMLREMYRIVRQNAPLQEIWLQPVQDSGVKPVWTLTIGSAATGTSGYALLRISDEPVQVQVSASDPVTTIAAALAAAINAYVNPLTNAMLPVIASASAGVLTLTHLHAGQAMDDLEIYLPQQSGNVLLPAGALTIAHPTAGTGTPALSTPLAGLADDQFDGIVCPWSDASAVNSCSAFTNETSGRWSYLRQSYGHIFNAYTGGLSAQVSNALPQNDRHLTTIPVFSGSPQPAYLWAAGMAGRVMPLLGDYVQGGVSINHTGLVVQGLTAPRNRMSWWGYAARNTALAAGVSTWLGNIDGTVAVDKLVTLQKTGKGGANDVTFRDTQSLFQATHILRYMRAQLAYSCTNKALVEVNPAGLGNLITPRDIRSVLIGAYGDLARFGVVTDVDGFARALNVKIDKNYGNRVNCFMAIDRVKPLDVLAANGTFYGAGIPRAA